MRCCQLGSYFAVTARDTYAELTAIYDNLETVMRSQGRAPHQNKIEICFDEIDSSKKVDVTTRSIVTYLENQFPSAPVSRQA
jgi:Ca2+-binding EF-hand superfamily protein